MIIKYINKNIKILIGLAYLLIILIILYYFFSYFDLKTLKDPEFLINLKNTFIEYKNINYVTFTLIFILISIFWLLLVGIGIPLALIAGLIYGKLIGTILCLLIISVSSVLFYSIVNFFFLDKVKDKILKKYYKISRILERNELAYVILFKLIEGIPFMIVNTLLALFNISKKNVFFATLIGLSPSIFIHVSIGSGLNALLNEGITNRGIFSIINHPEFYLPVFGLVLLTLLSIIIRNKVLKKNN
tara:strand:- start:619 stop:1353 length:735 start_codon:yes stop_codon:yes gene_type:complete